MSKQVFYILGILITILLGALLYNNLCCQNCCNDNIKNTVLIKKDCKELGNHNRFRLNGTDFNYSCNENFNFLYNDFNSVKPIHDSINIGINLLKYFFNKNPNQKLHIVGYALRSEKNTSIFSNLGTARANDVKNYFVSKGIATDHLETSGEVRDTLKISNDTILGAVSFRINAKKLDSNVSNIEWDSVKQKINSNPLILYFNTNQTKIYLAGEERQKIADLSNYLNHVSNAKISCVGHSDNVGNRDRNIKLGQNRADFAKEYLIRTGVSADKIVSSSKGPDEPISDNNSTEGKAKNRRVIITLK
jgi:OOP family OmpA-OmpF porin